MAARSRVPVAGPSSVSAVSGEMLKYGGSAASGGWDMAARASYAAFSAM